MARENVEPSLSELVDVLGAVHMEPGEHGTWVVICRPKGDLEPEHFAQVASAIDEMPGVSIAGSADGAITFALDLSLNDDHDPEVTLAYIADALKIERRDHAYVTECRSRDGQSAAVTFQFRTRHTQGQLADMASMVIMQGVASARVIGLDEIVITLNRHYASPDGIMNAVSRIAQALKVHVCGEITTAEPPDMSLAEAASVLSRFGVPYGPLRAMREQHRRRSLNDMRLPTFGSKRLRTALRVTTLGRTRR